MGNIKFEVINENMKGERFYALFKVSHKDNDGYCVAVQDDEFSVQGIGDNFNRASELYNLLLCAEVSAIHVGDVVRDMQNDFQSGIFV